MRKISAWARNHRHLARLFVIVIKLLLIFMALLTGRLLSSMGIALPDSKGYSALLILLLAAMLYPTPNRARLSKKLFYLRQKSCDFTLAICTFIAMVAVANNQLYPATSFYSYASNSSAIATQRPTAEEIIASLKYRDKKSLTKQEKRILRQEFKKQLKIFSKATLSGNKKDGDKAALIILVIIGAIGLTLLLTALVCSLSCGGAEGAAVAVALLGMVAIIWLSVALIRRINRGPRDRNKNWTSVN